ncbi:alpha-L-arabinofuranosidase [Opitutaceae bacterium TAV4]|nr:alpha-L-arabinofuranosidase [Opitutaceae bacterium TAV4]
MSPIRILFSITSFLAIALCGTASAQAIEPPSVPDKDTTAVFGAAVIDKAPVIREDPTAITGRYVGVTKAYQVLARAAVPSGGNTLHVWIRYRGLAIQMKTKPDGAAKMTEFPWNWTRNPSAFAWRKAGTFERSQLGSTVIFQCDTKFDEKSGLDAIVITTDAAWTPPGVPPSPPPRAAATKTDLTTDAPDAAAAVARATGATLAPESTDPGEATVSIDWSNRRGPVEPRLFSLNNFRASSLTAQSDPRWHEGMAYMAPRLLRLHNAGLVRTWYDPATDDWKYEQIAASLRAGVPPPGTDRMININSWPADYDTDQDRRLDPDKIDRFARLCADLVRFVNIDQKFAVRYWEVTNERDFAYWRKPAEGKQPDVAALATLYNAAAAAMRAVDPTIKIGGPAACNPLPTEPLVKFARLAADQLDFLSFHHYASGNADDPDQVIYDKTTVMAEDTADVIRRLRKILPARFPSNGKTPARPLEIHLNEYNICYNWRIKDTRMTDHKGAVFDALAMIAFAQVADMTAANAWNDRDGVYGKMDNQSRLRPAAHVYHYFNTLLTGTIVATETSAPRAVVSFATRNDTSDTKTTKTPRTLILVNRTAAVQTVTLQQTHSPAAVPPEVWQNATINEAGHYAARPADLTRPLRLEPHSVNVYWQ